MWAKNAQTCHKTCYVLIGWIRPRDTGAQIQCHMMKPFHFWSLTCVADMAAFVNSLNLTKDIIIVTIFFVPYVVATDIRVTVFKTNEAVTTGNGQETMEVRSKTECAIQCANRKSCQKFTYVKSICSLNEKAESTADARYYKQEPGPKV